MGSSALRDTLRDAQEIGAIGPAPLDEHIAHASAFVDASPGLDWASSRILDLGSGGGIPGLVVGERIHPAHLLLLDGRVERARRLSRVIESLGWSSWCEALACRAEVAGRDPRFRESFDIVLARGFASPAVTAECATGLLCVGGVLIVSEPPHSDGSEQVQRWPPDGCAQLGLERLETAAGLPWSFAVLKKVSACPDTFPRRVGVPSKRPVF